MGWNSRSSSRSGSIRAALLTLIAALLVVAVSANSAFAAVGTLVFSSDRGGNGSKNLDLWQIDADGSGLSQITSTTGAEFAAKWSPDGTKLMYAYQASNGRDQDLYVANADGTQPRRLTNSPESEGFASWTPDSKTIVFGRESGGAENESTVWSIGVDGSGERQLFTEIGGDLKFPTVSPDGKRVAVSIEESKTETIGNEGSSRTITSYTWQAISVEINGASADLITSREIEGSAGPLAWSPDSSVVYGTTNLDSGRVNSGGLQDSAIVRLSVATGLFSVLPGTFGNHSVSVPSVSPDGKYLSYSQSDHLTTEVSERPGKWVVRLLPLAGGSSFPITSPSDQSIFASWKPSAAASGTTPAEATSSPLGQKQAPPRNAEKFCKAPRLKGSSLSRAKAMLKQAGCSIGNVKKPKSRGRGKRQVVIVISQSRKLGSTSAVGAKIDLKLGYKSTKKKSKKRS